MKKTISLIMSVVMALSILSAGVSVNANAVYTYNDGDDFYKYEFINSSTVKIVDHTQHYSGASVLYIPETIEGYTVTVIDKKAFQKNFSEITEYVIPSTVTVIKEYAFYQGSSSNVTTLTIPSSVEEIEEGAFQTMKKLKTLNFSKGLKTIGAHAFAHCTALTKVVFPSTLTDIEAEAFSGCTSLSTITLNNNLKYIYNDAFLSHAAKSITIPKSVASIGASAFSSHSIQKATILSKNVNIQAYSSFYNGSFYDKGKKVKLYGFNGSTTQNYVNNGYNFYYYTFVSITHPTKTKITKLTAKKKAFYVKWAKSTNCDGYQIQYSLKKSMSSSKKKTVKGASSTSKTIKSLKKKKTYYVRVRAYHKYSGKTYYSSWSAKKKVKTK
ncbi:MAG: leucine-rich repeat domain-containing protein [Eubacterium sp.]|nr:leucine-rich repeat domain-containing protein [Eubacterium sp.]